MQSQREANNKRALQGKKTERAVMRFGSLGTIAVGEIAQKLLRG